MTSTIATIVYFLCFGASAGCGALLVRGYRRARTKLLLWTAACFVLLAANSFLVILDLVFLPSEIDLQIPRLLVTLLALATLLYGFIWELE